MFVTLDLFSVFPYLFTLVCLFGNNLFLALVLIAMRYPTSKTSMLPAVPVVGETPWRHDKPKPSFSHDQFNEVLPVIKKTAADLFPANKIVVRCGGCGAHIKAGEGYSHYNVGTRKIYCRDCHLSQGLPLRTVDGEKSHTVGEVVTETV